MFLNLLVKVRILRQKSKKQIEYPDIHLSHFLKYILRCAAPNAE